MEDCASVERKRECSYEQIRNNFQGTLSEKSECGAVYMKCWPLCNKEKIWIACIGTDYSGRTENRQR